MTTITVEGFRQEVAQRRGARRRGAPRYPEALVVFAVQHVQAGRSAGRSLHASAAELGLSAMTLSTWLKRMGDGSERRLREVVLSSDVVEEQQAMAARGLELTTPSGHVVRGLGVAEVAALLRALR